MLNRAPIFINGFPRGGTTILQNLIVSHPNVCLLSGETHQIFYGKPVEPIKKWVHRASYLPILATSRQHIFRPALLEQRNSIPRPLMHYVDLLFYVSKMSRGGNVLFNETERRSWKDISQARLLCKNMNGLALVSDVFADMYPDATFIALVRNGFAVCEGWIRRGRTAEYAGRMYSRVCERMIEDSQRMPNYHIIHFEDMISDPVSTVQQVYEYADLDVSQVTRFGLRARESMDKDGVRRVTVGQKRQTIWLDTEALGSYFRKDVNQNQIARLKESDREVFLEHARRPMEHFGYLNECRSVQAG